MIGSDTGPDAILPPGIHISVGKDENDNPAIRIDLRAKAGTATIDATLGLSPRQARALAALLLRRADDIEVATLISWVPHLVGRGEEDD